MDIFLVLMLLGINCHDGQSLCLISKKDRVTVVTVCSKGTHSTPEDAFFPLRYKVRDSKNNLIVIYPNEICEET